VFPNDPDGEGRAIGERWSALFFARDEEVRHRFVMGEVPPEWKEAAAAASWYIRMTPDEAAQLGMRLYALTHDLRSRPDPPPGAVETLVSVSVLPVVGEPKSS
jgi:hypothetical protein